MMDFLPFRKQHVFLIIAVLAISLHLFGQTASNDNLHHTVLKESKPLPRPISEMPRGYAQNYSIRNPFIQEETAKPSSVQSGNMPELTGVVAKQIKGNDKVGSPLLKLTGVVSTANMRLVIIYDGKESHICRIGETIYSYRLETIGDDKAIFMGPGGNLELHLER